VCPVENVKQISIFLLHELKANLIDNISYLPGELAIEEQQQQEQNTLLSVTSLCKEFVA
jgi:hypothetical protein